MNVNLSQSKEKIHKEGNSLLMLKRDKQEKANQQMKQDDSQLLNELRRNLTESRENEHSLKEKMQILIE